VQKSARRTCLRCDWAGDTDEPACPNCGVPLYAVGQPGTAPAAEPVEDFGTAEGGAPDEGDAKPAAPRRRDDGPRAAGTGPPTSFGLPLRTATPIAVVGLILAFVLGAWLGEPGDERASQSAPTDVAIEETADEGTSTTAPIVTFRTLVRRTWNVDGLQFSFDVLTSWERWDFSITRSIVGPQGAEAILFWTTLPDPARIQSCAYLSHASSGGSIADLTAAIASAPGTEIVEEPFTSSLRGHAISKVKLLVRKADGCQPGFFFRWPHQRCRGACWMEMAPGDTIDVWVTRVDGRIVLFEAATTDERTTQLEEDIERIVGSIRFDA
jgi:hypothetical protein